MSSSTKFILQIIAAASVTFLATFWLISDAPLPGKNKYPPASANDESQEVETAVIQYPNENKMVFVERPAPPDFVTNPSIRPPLHSPASWTGTLSVGMPVDMLTQHFRAYETDECSRARRNLIVATITFYFTRRNKVVDIINQPMKRIGNTNRYTNDGGMSDVKFAVSTLFSSGLLTLEDFPADARRHLRDFAPSGDPHAINRVYKCQKAESSFWSFF